MSAYEADIVGTAMLDSRVVASVNLTGDQFDDPRLGAAWDALTVLQRTVRQPSPIAVAERCAKAGVRLDPSLLVELVGRGFAVDASFYAERITDAAARRDLGQRLDRARGQLAEGAELDQVLADIDRVRARTSRPHQTFTLDQFVDRELPPTEWVIPGLFAKGERLIITGAEGLGKSTLIRMLAVCAAVGYDPFQVHDIPAQKVLVVDVENPERIMIEEFRKLRDALAEKNRFAGDNLHLHRAPEGLNLMKPRDRLTLHTLCREHQPDLLVIGPIYKLYLGGSNQREEDMARGVADTIDQLREDFGTAVILEHHSGHGTSGQRRSVRPVGSSLWLRWPEFGFGLEEPEGDAGRKQSFRKRYVEVTPWRGHRADRPWPEALESGDSLPWWEASPPSLRRTA